MYSFLQTYFYLIHQNFRKSFAAIRHCGIPPELSQIDWPARAVIYRAPQVIYPPRRAIYEARQVIYRAHRDVYRTRQVIYQWLQVIYHPRPVIYTPRQVIYDPRAVIYLAHQVIYTPQPDVYTPQNVISRLDYQIDLTRRISRLAAKVAKKRQSGGRASTKRNEANEGWDCGRIRSGRIDYPGCRFPIHAPSLPSLASVKRDRGFAVSRRAKAGRQKFFRRRRDLEPMGADAQALERWTAFGWKK